MMIHVQNLCFGYGHRRILSDLSFDVPAGSFLAVAGPNGSGKTTLVNLLCGILKAGSGSVFIDSADVRSYSPAALAVKVAVVRQEHTPAFGYSVAETVMMGRTVWYGWSGFESRRDREAADRAMEATDTLELADRRLDSLSGGERQRVFIARALVQESDILLLDEPTSFLDIRHQAAIYDLLADIQAGGGKTVVMITHDVNIAWRHCDHVLLLGRGGGYRHGPPAQVLTREVIEQVFETTVVEGRIGTGRFFMPAGRVHGALFPSREK